MEKKINPDDDDVKADDELRILVDWGYLSWSSTASLFDLIFWIC